MSQFSGNIKRSQRPGKQLPVDRLSYPTGDIPRAATGAKPLYLVGKSQYSPQSPEHGKPEPDPMTSANMNLMMNASRKICGPLLRDFSELEKLQTSVRGVDDFARKARARAYMTLKDELTAARPNYGWVCGWEEIDGADPTRRWIAQPLDGEINFRSGLPYWCVSLALEYKGEIVLASVHDPIRNETFYSEKGGGCWLNNQRRMRASTSPAMDTAVVAANLGDRSPESVGQHITDLERLLPVFGCVQSLGSVSLSLASIAAGRLDGYFQRKPDYASSASGFALLREAGGLAEPMDPDSEAAKSGVIAGNAQTFPLLASLLRQ